ncbi:MAG: aquaporin [Candidatus Acidiferrales bacterium]
MYRLSQKLLAEFIGTFTLVFIAAGSICAGQYARVAGQPIAGPPLGYALAYGLAAAVMVSALGHISGGHLNPAITISFWVTKRMGTIQTLLYGAVQLLGAAAAAYLLSSVVPEPVWRAVALGATDLTPDFTRMHGMLLEGLMTFFLVFVYFACAVDARGMFHKAAGFAVGLSITMDVLVGQPFTGASMNPARTFGPALAAHHWVNHGVYWVGPLLGGVLAGVIYDRFFLRGQATA